MQAMKGHESARDRDPEEAGNALFRLLFAQTGWMLLEPGMTKAAEGNPSSVQRSADGRAISHRWILGIAQTLAGMPGAVEEGKPVPLTRGQVRVTQGGYACLGGPCGHGCGAPDVGESMRIQ